jgi:hypothetical protein
MRIRCRTVSGKLMARTTENGDVAMTNKHLDIDASGHFVCTTSGPPS